MRRAGPRDCSCSSFSQWLHSTRCNRRGPALVGYEPDWTEKEREDTMEAALKKFLPHTADYVNNQFTCANTPNQRFGRGTSPP